MGLGTAGSNRIRCVHCVRVVENSWLIPVDPIVWIGNIFCGNSVELMNRCLY